MYTSTLVLAFAAAVSAHISFVPPTGTTNATIYTSFRISHGCNGTATTSVTVTLPDGASNPKPRKIAGWTITNTTNSITWASTEGLPDGMFEEFPFGFKTPAKLGDVYLPVEQKCVQGGYSWTEIPEAGKPEPKLPAGTIKLVAASATSSATTVTLSSGMALLALAYLY